jgi:hypothetical protein
VNQESEGLREGAAGDAKRPKHDNKREKSREKKNTQGDMIDLEHTDSRVGPRPLAPDHGHVPKLRHEAQELVQLNAGRVQVEH